MLPNTDISIAHVMDGLGVDSTDLATLRKHPNNNRWGFNNFTGPTLNLWGASLPTSSYRLGDYSGYEHTRRAYSIALVSKHGTTEQIEYRVYLNNFPLWSERPTYEISFVFNLYYSTVGNFEQISTVTRTVTMTQSPNTDTVNCSVYANLASFPGLSYGQTGYVYMKLASCSEDRRFDTTQSSVDNYTCITPQGHNMGQGLILPFTFSKIAPVGSVDVQVLCPDLLLYYFGTYSSLSGVVLKIENTKLTAAIVQYEIKAIDNNGLEFVGYSNYTIAAGQTSYKSIHLHGSVKSLPRNAKLKLYKRENSNSNWYYMYEATYTREVELK